MRSGLICSVVALTGSVFPRMGFGVPPLLSISTATPVRNLPASVVSSCIRSLLLLFTIPAALVLVSIQAQGKLESVDVESRDGFIALKSLSLSDGRKFSTSDLIGIELTHWYNADYSSGVLYPASQTTAPAIGMRAALLEDFYLNTGLRNIGPGNGVNSIVPLSRTPGVAFSFLAPVVNGPGDDVVVFVMDTSISSWGDNLLVSRLDGLGHTLMLSSNAQDNLSLGSLILSTYSENVMSLAELEDKPLSAFKPDPIYVAKGITFDLSSLGYASGDVVTGLFLQTPSENSNLADPLLIAGFPQVPECSAGALILCGGSGVLLLARRRRHI